MISVNGQPASPVAGTMGFRGLWFQVANTSVLAVICVAFLYGGRELLVMAREERAAHREDLRQQWELVRELHRSLEDNKRVMGELGRSIRELTEEVRKARGRPAAG